MWHPSGFIFDIDGTLTADGTPLPGAKGLLNALKDRNIEFKLATNGTGKSPAQLAEQLQSTGLPVTHDQIETSVTACVRLLKRQYLNQRIQLRLPERTKPMFEGIHSVDDKPDVTVLGDLGSALNNDLMNVLFNQIQDGAQLMCFHRNLYFQFERQWHLDTGAYVQALEAATDKPAIITGKPSAVFFSEIANAMNTTAEDIAVIGDDLSTDILGANYSGLTGYLIETGKYARGLRHPDSVADRQFADLNSLQDFIGL